MVTAGSVEERLLALRLRLAGDASSADASRSLSADNLAPRDMLALLEEDK